jgi:uncharacterized RDD family membrane protein YckC
MNQPSGQQPSTPPPSGGMPSWTSNITKRGTMPGPAGVALADTMDRIIAYVIDAIILGVVGFIIGSIMLSILGDNYLGVFGLNYRTHNLVSALAIAALTAVVSAAYFIGMWTRMGGATVGMKAMKLTVRDATSGAVVGQSQAITRWLYLAAPAALASIYVWGIIGWLISLAVLGYEIYLLYTTANSPTRQGFHDVQAKTVVAKG